MAITTAEIKEKLKTLKRFYKKITLVLWNGCPGGIQWRAHQKPKVTFLLVNKKLHVSKKRKLALMRSPDNASDDDIGPGLVTNTFIQPINIALSDSACLLGKGN